MPSIHVEEPIPEKEPNEPKLETPDKAIKSEPEEITPETKSESVAEPATASPVAQAPVTGRSHLDYKKFIFPGSFVILLALIILVISLVNDRSQLKQENSRLSSQTQKSTQDQSNKEAEDLKKEISQYLELPADEVPTVATVVDANKVKGQSFFVNAQNGDKVLLFATSGKAILYRPGTKKIVEVSPINLNQNQQSGTPPPSTTLTPKTSR